MAGGARGGDGSSARADSAPASHECAAVGASSDAGDGLPTVGASSDAGDGLLLADNETFIVGVGLGTVITLTAFALGTPVYRCTPPLPALLRLGRLSVLYPLFSESDRTNGLSASPGPLERLEPEERSESEEWPSA